MSASILVVEDEPDILEVVGYNLTQAGFEGVMGYNPSVFPGCGGDCPVDNVNWHEAAAYCNALSRAFGYDECYACSGSGSSVTCSLAPEHATPYECPGYRLPTEAEWEYAARATTSTATYNGDLASGLTDCTSPNPVLDSSAWFCCNSGGTTHPVGTRAPNSWGLHDMLGSLYEWCHDRYQTHLDTYALDPWGPVTGTHRTRRGGSWNDDGHRARAGSRRAAAPGGASEVRGFRPVRTLP